MTDAANLSGYWSGWYAYHAQIRVPAVPFTAWLEVSADGHLSGSTTEPNTFARTDTQELFADLTGEAGRDWVTFIKTYQAMPGLEASPIGYSGDVTEDGAKITGVWTIDLGTRSYQGSFELHRASSSQRARMETEKSAANGLL